MDLIIRNVRLADRRSHEVTDIGVANGRIVAIQRELSADAEVYDAECRLACPGLIESHIHLDKSLIIDRCAPQELATPYGDCSLIRIANLYANVVQIDRADQLRECFRMLTDRSALLLNIRDYGFGLGHPADIVIINAQSPEQAISEIAQPVAVFKNGRQTVRWDLPQLLRPQ